MKKNQLVIIISVLVVLAGVGIAAILIINRPVQQPPQKFETIKYANMDNVSYSDYPLNIEATGRVRAKDKVDVFAEVQGIYNAGKKLFKEGIYFKQGETMIQVDTREADLNLKTQKSDLLNAITSLMADIKTDFPASYDNWKNYLDAFEVEEDIDPLPEPQSDKEKYFLSSRNIYKLYYSIKNSEVRLRKHTIKAPFSGTVTLSTIDPGTLIRPNAKLGEFAGNNVYEVTLAVRSVDLPFIKVGAKVDVQSRGKIFNGRVTRISDRIDPSTQSINVFVQISGSGLKDGMYVTGKVSGRQIEDVYKVPREALINNEDMHIVEKDSTLNKETVELVYLGKNNAYIQGLDSGTTVITEPLANVKLGTKIKKKAE